MANPNRAYHKADVLIPFAQLFTHQFLSVNCTQPIYMYSCIVVAWVLRVSDHKEYKGIIFFFFLKRVSLYD